MKLVDRGRKILKDKGLQEFLLRTSWFVRERLEVAVIGTIAKRNSPLNYHGVDIPVRMNVFDNKIRHAFATESYEVDERKLIDEHVSGSYDLVDLGASTGFSTTYALNRMHEDVRAVAVEANPEMIDVLEEVKHINDVKFFVEASAYDPTRSKVTFYTHDKTVSGSTERYGGMEVVVPAISLSDIIDEHGLEEFVCLVDIEGGELNLFTEEMDVLEEYCTHIVVEIHDMDDVAGRTKRKLEASKFRQIDKSQDVYVYSNESL